MLSWQQQQAAVRRRRPPSRLYKPSHMHARVSVFERVRRSWKRLLRHSCFSLASRKILLRASTAQVRQGGLMLARGCKADILLSCSAGGAVEVLKPRPSLAQAKLMSKMSGVREAPARRAPRV